MTTIQSNHVWLEGEYQPATLTVEPETGRIASVARGLCLDAENALGSTEIYVLPGLIDCHTHAAMSGPGGDATGDQNDPYHFDTPYFRAIDATNPFDACYEGAARAGITALCVLPGAYCVVGGQAGVLRTVSQDPFGYILRENAGMKAALGARPKMAAAMAGNTTPQTKMAVYAMLRDSLLRARQSLRQAAGRDLAAEGWEKVLTGEAPLRVHCHRIDDIVKALQFAEEMQIRVVLEHATGAVPIADELAQRQIPVVCSNTIMRVPQLPEENQATEHYAADLMKKGVRVALSTNFPEVAWEALALQAGECLRQGVEYARVIEAVTVTPAEILGMQGEIGKIQAGMWADLSFWSGAFGHFEARPVGVMSHGEWYGRGERA